MTGNDEAGDSLGDALSEDEAALLAASLPRPREWHPGVARNAYRRYAENIRRRMDRSELPGRLLQ